MQGSAFMPILSARKCALVMNLESDAELGMLPVMAAQCGNGLKVLFPSCSPRSTQLHMLALLCAQRDLGGQYHHT